MSREYLMQNFRSSDDDNKIRSRTILTFLFFSTLKYFKILPRFTLRLKSLLKKYIGAENIKINYKNLENFIIKENFDFGMNTKSFLEFFECEYVIIRKSFNLSMT
jgi:hypothetical protein